MILLLGISLAEARIRVTLPKAQVLLRAKSANPE
jgi:hypothetical protein